MGEKSKHFLVCQSSGDALKHATELRSRNLPAEEGRVLTREGSRIDIEGLAIRAAHRPLKSSAA
jgi:hypothetical protein